MNKYVTLHVSGDFRTHTLEIRNYNKWDDFLADMFNFDEETSQSFNPANRDLACQTERCHTLSTVCRV